MVVASNMFIGSLERWMRAVQASDLNGAKFEAEQLKLGADLLVVHPDFRKCFHNRSNGFDPKQALELLTSFLLCTIEGRVQALKQQNHSSAQSGHSSRS